MGLPREELTLLGLNARCIHRCRGGGVDNPTAKTLVSVVKAGPLAWRDRALRLLKDDLESPVGQLPQLSLLVGLAIPHFDSEIDGQVRRAIDPGNGLAAQLCTEQGLMLVTLGNTEDIIDKILLYHVPGLVRCLLDAANTKTLSLT
jgi:hypothetical protein